MTRREELIELTKAALRGPALAECLSPPETHEDAEAYLGHAAVTVAENALAGIGQLVASEENDRIDRMLDSMDVEPMTEEEVQRILAKMKEYQRDPI